MDIDISSNYIVAILLFVVAITEIFRAWLILIKGKKAFSMAKIIQLVFMEDIKGKEFTNKYKISLEEEMDWGRHGRATFFIGLYALFSSLLIYFFI